MSVVAQNAGHYTQRWYGDTAAWYRTGGPNTMKFRRDSQGGLPSLPLENCGDNHRRAATSQVCRVAAKKILLTLVMRGALFRHLSTTDTSRARGLLRKRMNRSGLQTFNQRRRCTTDAPPMHGEPLGRRRNALRPRAPVPHSR